MIICRVCQSFNERLTELSTHMVPLTNEQIKSGINVQVVVKNEGFGQDKPYIHTFDYEKKGINKFLPFSALHYGNMAYEVMKKLDYDLIHGHQQVCFGLVFKRLKKPFVYTAHDLVALPSELEGGLKKKYASFAETLLLCRKAKVVTCVSEILREKLIRKYNIRADKVYTIPPGFYPSIFKPGKTSKTEKIVLFVGRMIKRKGVLTLIKSIPIVRKKVKNAKFLFVGLEKGQELYDFIKSSRITGAEFINEVSQEKLAEYYKECSVCVLPARLEAAGKTIIEAIGCSKPVIVGEEVGLSQAIKENNAGIIVPFDDVDKLSNAIIDVLKDEALAKQMGRNGLKASKNFSWHNIAKKYNEVYEKALM